MRLPAATPTWSVRLLFAWQTWRYGLVLNPTRLWARSPRLLWPFMRLFAALQRRSSPLPAALRAAVAVRVSQLLDCSFCVDMNWMLMLRAGADPQRLAAVSDWRRSDGFSPAERAALAYAEAMTATPSAVDDAAFAALRAHFSDEAIVELTALVGIQNLSARFNHALAAQAYGFCAVPGTAPRAP